MVSFQYILSTVFLFPFLTSSLHQQSGCPVNSQSFGDFCFFVSTESLTFENARIACKNTGGNLATIINLTENEFVFSQLLGASPSWIGYNDIIEEGLFEWVDNSTVAFENWNIGEPNDLEENHDCTKMRVQDGLWKVDQCSKSLPYVCKAPRLIGELPSCKDGTCGSNSPVCNQDKCCYCDDHCLEFGDCCDDYALVCARQEHPITGACDGSCGIKSSSGSCWCDEECVKFGDCCEDACERCGYNCVGMSDNKLVDNTQACDGSCGLFLPVENCGCDEVCEQFGDCCTDVCETCGFNCINVTVIYEGTCEGSCGLFLPVENCGCDEACVEFGDCCTDVCESCGYICNNITAIDTNTCEGSCGIFLSAANCGCDEACVEFGDCCSDVCKSCGYNCKNMLLPASNSTSICSDNCGIFLQGENCGCDEACTAFGDCCTDACESCGYNCNTITMSENSFIDEGTIKMTVPANDLAVNSTTAGPTFLRRKE